MPYIKTLAALVVIVLIIRSVAWLWSKLKQKIIRDHENKKHLEQALYRMTINSPQIRRALQIEKLHIAREFFLKPGVIRRRSCAGTDEDDR